MSLKLTFIGFGEVGRLFSRQLAAKSAVEVTAADILFHDPSASAEMKRFAAQSDVRTAEGSAQACRGADIVISAVTAGAALAVAREVAPSLAPPQIYVDLNSVSPRTKRLVGAEAERNGAAFVEFAVMSAVAELGIAAPILAGGAQAEAVAARLNPLGMAITPVSREVGVASATKLCRSIVIKGLEALMVDLNLAAAKTGVLPAVLASLNASYPGMDWSAVAHAMPERVRRHGARRAAEMREAGLMLAEMGLSASLVEAIAERHETFAAPVRI